VYRFKEDVIKACAKAVGDPLLKVALVFAGKELRLKITQQNMARLYRA